MSLIEWDDAIFSVGISKIDEQHKQLIGLINALHSAKVSTDKNYLDRVFSTLILYTQNHFHDEERMLAKMHWPKLSLHHAQHERFIKSVTEMKAKFEERGSTPELLEKLTHFLKDWITQHILVEDKEYGEYLTS